MFEVTDGLRKGHDLTVRHLIGKTKKSESCLTSKEAEFSEDFKNIKLQINDKMNL
jgi:hypothetical protein